jgi:hypothetical protein
MIIAVTGPVRWHRRWWAAAGAIVLLTWSQFAWVSPTNFYGYDEWLILSLVSRGILSFPYANRPLMLAWNLPTTLAQDPLAAYYILHGTYLALSGVLVFLLVRRLAPGRLGLAWLAGAFAATWAPRDQLRLDTIQMLAYSGFMVGMLLSLLLLVEWWRSAKWVALAAGCVLALGTARGYEAVFPFLLGAPPLLAVVAPFPTGWRWALAWYGALGVGLVQFLWPLSAAPDLLLYQGRFGSSDLSLTQVAGQTLQHYGFELFPLINTPARDLAVPAVLPTLAVFWLASAVLLPRSEESLGDRRGTTMGMLLGIALAGLGWGMIAPLPALATPDRTQFLPAPGIGLLLAAAVSWLASWLPTRWRRLGVAVFGSWIMWVGTARVLSLQRQWDEQSAFPDQVRLLRELTRVAPDLRPHTLVVLIDRTQSWRPFAFRYAIEYVYDGHASGFLAASRPNLLYTTRFTDAGVFSEPLAAIRGPWKSPPTLYRYDEVLLVRYDEDRSVTVLDHWPRRRMHPLPAGAVYAPQTRIVPSREDPPARVVLR